MSELLGGQRHFRCLFPPERFATAGDDFRAEQLEIRADAYPAEEQSLPVVAEVSCEIAVDGAVYERNSYSHTAVCKVDFEEVRTPPESTGNGSLLWLGHTSAGVHGMCGVSAAGRHALSHAGRHSGLPE
jgi:hypothetical protein